MDKLDMRRQRLITIGFTVSLLCLLYLSVVAFESANHHADSPLSLSAVTTTVRWLPRTVTALFALLNIPPLLILLVLEEFVPPLVTVAVREVTIYCVVALAVIGWWWLLGALSYRRASG